MDTEIAPAAALRRAELARAAYSMIAERGIDGLSLRALARSLGATTGLLSHHFLDRAELVSAALDHAADVIEARIVRAGVDASPIELLALVLPTDAETIENWRFSFSIRTAAMFDPSLRTFSETITGHWERNLPERLADLVDGDPLEATHHLVLLVDGIALHAVLDPDGWPESRQRDHLRRGFDALTRNEHA